MFGKIPDDMILSDGLKQARAARSAYMLKPRGKGPKRYTPHDYVKPRKEGCTWVGRWTATEVSFEEDEERWAGLFRGGGRASAMEEATSEKGTPMNYVWTSAIWIMYGQCMN
jgi:hypothetical protein